MTSSVLLSTLFYVFGCHTRPLQAFIWSWKPSNGWQAKTTHSGNTSPKQLPQTTLPTLYKLQVAQKRCSFCSDLREPICCLNAQSGSRSPLNWLFESCEEVAVLELILRACLLPYGSSRSPGLPKWLPSHFWKPGSRFWSRFPRLYKVFKLVLSKHHLTIRVNPQQVNPLKSFHIDETMVGLWLVLLPRARPKSKSTALFILSGPTKPFNLS